MSNIQKEILKTLCFYDIFNYPLTPIELWQQSSSKSDLSDILKTLPKINETLIAQKNGFYFLPGRKEIVDTRIKRYNHTLRKIKRIHLISNFFKFIPSISLIAIGNSIGAHNLKDSGDIDLLIITKPQAIWTTRFITTSLMKITGLRPQENNQKDKICLSFFLTEKSQDLNQLKACKEDHYLTHWLSNLYPIYNKNNAYEKLIGSNAWLHYALPNWKTIKSNPKYYIETNEEPTDLPKKPSKTEIRLKKLQLKILPQEIKNSMNTNTSVIVNDNILKFHTKDRRIEYNNLFNQKWKSILSIYQNT